jgi:hypothetical protein
MDVCLCCVVLCFGRGLCWTDPPSKESY